MLLCVLWVRSYWSQDVAFVMSGGHRIQGMSLSGSVFLARVEESGSERNFLTGPIFAPKTKINAPQFSFLGFVVKKQSNATSIVIPYWLLAISCACVAPAAWRDWRFSLRTLLIATTLVALLLGLFAWMR